MATVAADPIRVPMSAPAVALDTPTSAASAPIDPSIIADAWGFSPQSDRYTNELYRPNELTLASYSTRPNEAPFEVLFDALEYPDAKLQSTEAEFQLSFKARLWASEDRRFGLWAAYTQDSQWQALFGCVLGQKRSTIGIG